MPRISIGANYVLHFRLQQGNPGAIHSRSKLATLDMSPEQLHDFILLPAFIFFARIFDVSFGTLRIISVSRGQKLLAAVLGFVEILIWIFAISQIFNNLNNPACYFAYACGFATGNYMGIVLEERIAMGSVMLRVVTREDGEELCAALRQLDIGVTEADAHGASGPVKVIFAVVKRRDLARVMETVRQFNPKAFFTIEDVRTVSQGVFPTHRMLLPMAMRRPGK